MEKGFKQSVATYFLVGLAVVYSATALLKLQSLLEIDSIYLQKDPVFNPLNHRFVMGMSAAVEICAVTFAWHSKSVQTKAVTYLWLSLIFILYRIGRVVVGVETPCPCLGKLGGQLPFLQSVTDALLITLLMLTVIGCSGIIYKMSKVRLQKR